MTLKQTRNETPLYIKVHPNDNVAIIVNEGGLPKGTVFSCGLELTNHVPQGHKVALKDLNQGEAIMRYGEMIGYAVQPIVKGSWIDESLVQLPTPPRLEELSIASNVPALLPPLEGYTFEGYRNVNGSVGTKNILGITTSVQCVAGVLEYTVKRIKAELLPKYPNVEDVVALTHTYGCGVAINAPDAIIPIRTILNLAQNPNFGGELMVVGLGCEKLNPERLVPEGDSGKIISLQEHHGFIPMVKSIMEMAEVRLDRLNRRKRVTCPASDLVVGLQCGGSDAFSGVTANPAVGYAADLLVRAGATVMFSEVTEVRDAVHLLTPRASSEEVGRALIREMKWYDDYLQNGQSDRSANPTPGNKKGGLANVVEKSLGSIVKSGTSPIVGVLSPGERAVEKGLIFAATPASDFVCGTLQLASGINLQVFTTGRGTPYGLAVAPVIKVSTRNSLAEQWHDLIDLNAGRIATGEATIEEIGWEIFHLILDVASGRKKAWADHWGLYNDLALFNPAPVT
ncbi:MULTISPECIES: galactarate dehydratase [unclassified Paenibacillus]|uniref:galactarate dehydratase n=1 Tax=unclassified Paenibacillus TaxID=185978 RepID=UPI0027809DDF|nr:MULTISPECIES: galactarate dehydratase [unclassified Paenibacillus]MDQ0897711.1 galactarate dehydratase [Paenibacillus sp. V4I7]MDQ0916296.1 galactarate dehydratase [Paenibacillus sp. V4I5]